MSTHEETQTDNQSGVDCKAHGFDLPFDLTVFLLCQIVITGDFSKQYVLPPYAQSANSVTVGTPTPCLRSQERKQMLRCFTRHHTSVAINTARMASGHTYRSNQTHASRAKGVVSASSSRSKSTLTRHPTKILVSNAPTGIMMFDDT